MRPLPPSREVQPNRFGRVFGLAQLILFAFLTFGLAWLALT